MEAREVLDRQLRALETFAGALGRYVTERLAGSRGPDPGGFDWEDAGHDRPVSRMA